MSKSAFLFSSLYYPNVGGVENSIKEISAVLKARGYKVIIITSDRDLVNRGSLSSYDNVFGVDVVRCRYPFGFWGFAIFLISLFKTCKRLGVLSSGLVVSRSHWPVLAVRVLGVKSVKYLVPSVYFYQECVDIRYLFSRRILGFFVNSFAQFLAFIFSDSCVFSVDMCAQVRRASLGLCRPTILRPGVSRDRFFAVDANQKLSIRRELGLEPELKYLLCVGRVSEIKQFDLAVGALKYLGPHYHLIIVGSGPHLESLKCQSRRECVADRVSFYSFTDDVDLFYKAADVYLMTSRYESFGQVLVEATSCGLPVVGFSSVSGVRTSVSYIYKGYSSLFFPCDEQCSFALSKTIDLLVAPGSKFRSEMVDFVAGYSWEATVDKLLLK